jgi:hypothetical protein
MKFIITENKLNDVALSWINDNYSPNKLEVVKHKEYPDLIFFRKDGKVVMEQDNRYQDFYFDYDEVWLFFKLFLGMEDDQIRKVLRYWLGENFKLEGYTPRFVRGYDYYSWVRLSK